jgi:signal transduction histidine kinase
MQLVGRIQKAFLPFKRVGDLTREGSGMGLAICRRIARKTGGDIDFRGEVGVGTSFYVGIGEKPMIPTEVEA